MKQQLRYGLALAAGLVFVAAGCGKQSGETTTPSEAKGTQTDTQPKTPAATLGLSEEAVGLTREALSIYEDMRADLAVDKTGTVPALAAKLSGAVKAAGNAAPHTARPRYQAVVTAADKLAEIAGSESAKVRLQFGEVSRPIVALLVAAPELAGSYHVFQCPMAKGYKRWVQPTASLSNPYMGTRMPTCGMELEFSKLGSDE